MANPTPTRLLIVPAIALLLCAGTGCGWTPYEAPSPAPAAAAQAAAADGTVAAVDDSDKLVCKKYTITGSRIAKRTVCKTRAEWIEYAQHMKEAMRNAERRSAGSGPPPSMGGG